MGMIQMEELHLPGPEKGAGTAMDSTRKRPYHRLTISTIDVLVEKPVLAASVVDDSAIVVVGQEVGFTFDLGASTGFDTDKTFSHEWDVD